MGPEDRRRARVLYEMGLAQFNHYVNNRDRVVTESRFAMESLVEHMDQSEISLAESTGNALVRADKGELPETLIQYNSLRPQTQIYAQHKRREHVALQSIANDLSKNVPRTDYTSVKSRIESGEMPLDTIVSELPLPWQELRTINEKETPRRIVEKPPKREFIHMIFLTQDGRVLEDKRAERDGRWIRSDKHNLLVPYQEPAQVWQTTRPDRPPVPTGKYRVIISSEPSAEWITECWRQGGYIDQQYRLARDDRLPEQLRRAYRWRLFSMGIRAVAISLFVIYVVVLGVWYFS